MDWPFWFDTLKISEVKFTSSIWQNLNPSLRTTFSDNKFYDHVTQKNKNYEHWQFSQYGLISDYARLVKSFNCLNFISSNYDAIFLNKRESSVNMQQYGVYLDFDCHSRPSALTHDRLHWPIAVQIDQRPSTLTSTFTFIGYAFIIRIIKIHGPNKMTILIKMIVPKCWPKWLYGRFCYLIVSHLGKWLSPIRRVPFRSICIRSNCTQVYRIEIDLSIIKLL